MLSIIGNEVYNKFMYSLWFKLGKPSFLSNVVEEIRPSCISLQRSLFMINLFEIFLGGVQ